MQWRREEMEKRRVELYMANMIFKKNIAVAISSDGSEQWSFIREIDTKTILDLKKIQSYHFFFLREKTDKDSN